MTDDGTTLRREPSSMRAPQQSLLLYHRGGVKVVPLPRGAKVVLGRTWPSDAVVDDKSLSRQHARLTAEEDGVAIEDLESTNGTWVNGARVARAKVGMGDVLRLGDVTCALHVVAAQRIDGAVSYDRFRAALDEETQRAQSFRRTLAVLMLRAKGREKDGLDAFLPALLGAVRPVDRIGAYAEDTVLVMLPEVSADEARTFALSFAAEHGTRVGCSVYPEDGVTGEELLEAARGSLVRGGPASSSAATSAAPLGGRVVVQNPRMRAVFEEIARVAPSMLPVLVNGETGTGKELVARAVHEQSPRQKKPFRSVNCGAIPQSLVEGTLFGHERGAFTSADRTTKGLFEQASGGTLFLDEIGELPASAQAALLRVLETRKLMRVGGDKEIDADVRVVAATHRDLEQMTREGSFRTDLLYRLNAVVVALPPLRERTEEIDQLAAAFIADASASSGRNIQGVDSLARAALRAYAWPGNVRELKNVIERAVVVARGDRIGVDDLPERLRGAPPGASASAAPQPLAAGVDFKDRVREQMRTYESELILAALTQSGGNQTEAARLLGMPVRTLAHKMKELGIKKGFTA